MTKLQLEIYGNLLLLNFLKQDLHKHIYLDFLELYLKENKNEQ